MTPSSMLELSQNGGAARITGFSNDLIQVIGSSIPISRNVQIEGKEKQMDNSLIIVLPTEKKEGLVVIRVIGKRGSGKSFSWIYQNFFLKVSCIDGKTFVDLKAQWIPQADPDKMATVSTELIEGSYAADHNLEVGVGEEIFTGNRDYKEKPGKRYVDNDFICQYLIGDITKEELKEKATELEEEVDIRQKLAKMEKELEDTKKLLKEANKFQEYNMKKIAEEKDHELEKWQRIIRELAVEFAIDNKDEKQIIEDMSIVDCVKIIKQKASLPRMVSAFIETPWWSFGNKRIMREQMVDLCKNLLSE